MSTTEHQSLPINIRRGASPAELALLMWTREIQEHIWQQTEPHLTARDCPVLERSDISKFFGMLLIFSCYPSRTLHGYFTTGVGARVYPANEHFLSRNAFTAIHAQLHFDLDMLHSSLVGSFQHHLIPSTSTCVWMRSG